MILRCVECGLRTSDLEASLRRFLSGRCSRCGSALAPELAVLHQGRDHVERFGGLREDDE